MVRIEPVPKLVVIFDKGGKRLTVHVHPIEAPEDERTALLAAYDHFRKDNPDVALLDGVRVIFDEVD